MNPVSIDYLRSGLSYEDHYLNTSLPKTQGSDVALSFVKRPDIFKSLIMKNFNVPTVMWTNAFWSSNHGSVNSQGLQSPYILIDVHAVGETTFALRQFRLCMTLKVSTLSDRVRAALVSGRRSLTGSAAFLLRLFFFFLYAGAPRSWGKAVASLR